jgi:FAD/FMN-containing dehydrogenase
MSPSYAKPTTPAEMAAQSAQLSEEAYRALEDIVGAENVSRDAAILDGYAFQYLAELIRPAHSHYMPRPAAVVLPASTEEVQAVVLAANEHGFKVKPTGTGWYMFNAVVKEDDPTVQLDLRRMDAIVEIDEQNMYAVVEPYVIHAQLQAEALKLGMNINIPGSGCSTSIVASACAYAGQGPFAYFLGGNAENVLGMEWVTPAGEIVRTGSLGSGDGWFCSEGPGPSVRGICRGALGSRGGLGVYTKCAVKLGPSLGSEKWDVGGTLPAYRLPLAATQRAYTIAVPSWDAWADAYYEIYDNEIGYIFHRQFNLAGADLAAAFWLMYNDHSRTLADVPAIAAQAEVQELTEELRISFQLVLAGRSVADIELQDRILDAILEEVGGHKVERFCEQDMAEFTNVYLQRLGHKHINFVWAGGYIGSWMQFGTPDWVKGYIPTAAAGLERDAAGGKLVQCGGDAMMGSGSGIPGGGGMGLEQFVSYDPDDEASTHAAYVHMEDAIKDAASIGYPPGKEGLYLQMGWSDERFEQVMAAAAQPAVFRFQRRIKTAFDPHDVGDRMYPTLPLGPDPDGANASDE